MRILIYTLVLVGVIAASPLFGSSDDSSESEESTTVAPTEYQREDSQEESIETTVISREGDDQSISTEETTVIEETPAPVDHNGRVDVAHRIDDDRREEGSEERTQERRDDDEDTTTVNPPELPTAMAQMMGQLEIRLIDENNTQTHVESVIEPPPLSPITPYIRDDEDQHETTPDTPVQEGDSTADPNEISEQQQQQSNAEYDAKWKKVEYVSDTVLNLETTTTVTTGEETEEVPTSSPDATLPSVPQTEEIPDTTTTLSPMDQVALQKIQSAFELGTAKKMPEGPFPDAVTDEDLPVIEGISVDDEEDDPEPVEECLANRHQLADEVVHRMEKQVERLSKMVRKLGKQQSQYCTQAADETTDRQLYTDTYSQCPIWREEKIVHYYKLMRITYCADYGKWPNGSKMVRTYGQYLPLFETLYAFQKQ
ncbi:hypothetical protein PRIPAC_76095 [Pristionchus pacificus]|uniref:Uncharacterized protein n=1 Tax=Pristionchus pacificus TaxID=54126 RepID=A0A2A6BZN5_PRIPA|nr:hypothetical protein PRIPAC_76095 [Pristionchus pacificus]|eukprot:PDM71404.1 hypothetical protein PRIPAC_37811 [Pristionchus pacificus]